MRLRKQAVWRLPLRCLWTHRLPRQPYLLISSTWHNSCWESCERFLVYWYRCSDGPEGRRDEARSAASTEVAVEPNAKPAGSPLWSEELSFLAFSFRGG